MSISVVLPAYREAENLRVLLPQVTAALNKTEGDWEVLVVDTLHSTEDGTREVCQENGVTCLNRKGGNYYGDAIRTGIKEAQYDRIVIMDADGSHNPADILRMQQIMGEENLDLVIGSRYMEGGKTHNGPILRLMSMMVNLSYRLLFRIKVKDVSDSFRMYDAQKLKRIPLQCNNFDIVEEILILFQVYYPHGKIKEIPVYFNKRMAGESKRNLIKFVLSYLITMERLLKIKREARKQI